MKLKFYMFTVYITQLSITFFPLLIKNLGLSDISVGVILAAPFIFALLFSTLWGRFADKKPGLKKTLAAALAASGLLFVCCAIPMSAWLTVAVYVLCQFFLLPLLPLSDALCVGDRYAQIRLWGTVGLIFANIIAGFLGAPYLLCAAGCLAAFCVLFTLSDKRPSKKEAARGYVREVLSDHRLFVLYLLAVAVNAAVSVQGAFFSIYFVNELGFPASLLGVQAALRIAGEIPFLFFIKKIDRRLGAKKTVALSLLITGVRMVLIGTIRNLTIILITVALLGASYVLLQYYLVKIGDEAAEKCGAKSRIQSLSNIFTNFPRVTGTVLGGVLVSRFGYEAVSLWCGIFVLACFALFLTDKKFS